MRWSTIQKGGRKFGIPYGRIAATCPVRALETWLADASIKPAMCSPSTAKVVDGNVCNRTEGQRQDGRRFETGNRARAGATSLAGAHPLQGTVQKVFEVKVVAPTAHPHAEELLRQGNWVRMMGQLDCRMEFQGGESVRTKLAEINAEWAERKEAMAAQAVELRRAES